MLTILTILPIRHGITSLVDDLEHFVLCVLHTICLTSCQCFVTVDAFAVLVTSLPVVVCRKKAV